jgi:hypothetical protein
MNFTDGMTREQWVEWFKGLSNVKQQVVMLLVDTLVEDMQVPTREACLMVYEGMVMVEAGESTKH